MKINAISNIKSNYNKSFKSLRTDKNTISILKNGENPLLDNTKFNIYAALSNISKKYPEKENIEFLLDIADNLEYGQGGNSEFKDILDEDGVTEGKRENTDWSLILKDTVKRALKRNNDEDINDLIIKYSQTFETKKELTENQKKILELRENLTENLISENITEDSEELERTTRIRKNLDYFISSSEISGKQKEECLEKFIYFMSDEYKINPQLTGKKKQVLDEVLNDIVIKTPDEEILKTKKVDQIFSGICASISVCRKLMAYEDKSGYVDLIMEELKDSPKMSVYDITQLGTGKKVDIPKADIDYTRAMYLGYRIIDNAAHLWMQNAHTIGDGTRVTEKFVGIDNDNYGIFDDSSWYEGLPEERKEEKNLLKALIKENEFLENVSKTQKEIKHSYSDMISVKKDFEQTKKQTLINLENILNEVFPSSTDKENRKLITNLCEFYSGQNENNEVNVAAQLPDEVKQKIVSDYIIENTEQEKITPESGTLLKEKAPEIIKLLNMDKGAEKALNGIKNYSSVNSKYNYSKNLFKLAAAHRIAIENDINLPNGIIRFEKFTGLPPRDEYVSSFLNTLKQSFSSETVRKKYANGTKDIPSQKELELELMKDSASVESYIPQNLDNISKTYLGADLQEIILESYRNNLKEIENGNDEVYENILYYMDLKDDKSGVIKHLNKWISKLSDNPSKEEVSEAIRNFGFTDRFNMLQMLLNTTYESINNSYSPDKAKQEELLQHFSQGIQNVKTLEMKYNSILSKWNVPSQQAAVLNNLEKEGFILSRNNLNSLSATFDRISSEQINNIENVQNEKEKNRKLKKLRSSIPDKDKRILNSIEKSFPNIKAYAKNRYRIINTTMRDDLDKQYAELGMLSGSFWVREEGSSGLMPREQIRILEQMTGKPYYIETDVNNAVKKIKQGTGSGILGSNVDNTEYSGHAQYIPLISREKFTDFATGKKTKKDVLWTDNSWGKSEKKSYWNGHNGFNYTDYKSGYGWDKGYIAADDFKIGLPVEDMTGAVGYNKKEDYSFPLVNDIILSGNNTKTYKNLFKVFNEIISMNNYNIYLDKLEDKIKSGEKVDIKTLSSLDKLPDAKQNQIHKKLEQDFDKLDDELKFMFDKLSVYYSTGNEEIAENALTAKTPDELQEVSDSIFEEHIDDISSIIAKSPKMLEELAMYCSYDFQKLFNDIKDKYNVNLSEKRQEKILNTIFNDTKALEKYDGSLPNFYTIMESQVKKAGKNYFFRNRNAGAYFINKGNEIIKKNLDEKIKINSLEDLTKNSTVYSEALIKSVDKYLNPKDDEELLEFIQELQYKDFEEAGEFLDNLTPQDAGMNLKSAYDYYLKYKCDNSSIIDKINEIITYDEFNNYLPDDDVDSTVPAAEQNLSLENLYRILYIKLTDMDVQKYINQYKSELFRQYKTRQAFPSPELINKEEIVKITNDLFKVTDEYIETINENNNIIKIYDIYNIFKHETENEPLYNALKEGKNTEITDENIHVIKLINEKINALYEITKDDDSLENENIAMQTILDLTKNIDYKREINFEEMSKNLNILDKTFYNPDSYSKITNEYTSQNKELLKNLKDYIKYFIDVNIEPKYRNDALQSIEKYIQESRKENPSDNKLTDYEDKMYYLMENKHIASKPITLFNEYIKVLQSENPDSDLLENYKIFLNAAIKSAALTKIQYQLVKNQFEGIGSKLKEMLPLFCVYDENDERHAMNTDEGILYLINVLQNPNDNHTVLNILLSQAGMEKEALKTLIESYNTEEIAKGIDNEAESIAKNLKEIDKLMNYVNEFIEKSKIKFRTFNNARNHLLIYLERQYANEDNQVYNSYKQFLNSIQIDNTLKNLSEENIIPFLVQMNLYAYEPILQAFNNNLENFQEYTEMIENINDMLNSINVPVDSQVYQQREECCKKLEDINELIICHLNEIYEKMSQCKNLNIKTL